MASSVAALSTFVASMSDLSVFPPNVNVHLPIDKLDGKNYSTWAFNVKLWLRVRGILIMLPST